MRKTNAYWLVLLGLVFAAIILPLFIFLPSQREHADPWTFLPERPPHTDHSSLMKGPFPDGPSVTEACLACHQEAAHQVMQTSHWTWESQPVTLPGHDEPVRLGKKNAINNFCIGIRSNWPPCTACHAGYGWEDAQFDFKQEKNVDCLVCHDNSGTYSKGNAGFPKEDVDLVSAAQSVGGPTRANCGTCHFRGGGGNAVKHGDLDESLYFPSERIDVHMGKYKFLCTDCHQSQDHNMKGKAISVSFDDENQVACTDCHAPNLHKDDRINSHVASVACQSCHIPSSAKQHATKTHWDWSAAGEDIPEDPHVYLKKKGRFEYQKDLLPEYSWYNGLADHYILGDPINPDTITVITSPRGDISDPDAKIWPFKVHRARQIYDAENNYLIQPKTVGKGGYWTDFDWDKAARLGSEAVGLEYSGHYGFTDTEMFWPITHMVSGKEEALQCVDCHGESPRARMNWEQLGYPGDPIYYGGRQLDRTGKLSNAGGGRHVN